MYLYIQSQTIAIQANKNDENKQPKQNYNSVTSSADLFTKRIMKDNDGSMRTKRSNEKNKEGTNKRDVVD